MPRVELQKLGVAIGIFECNSVSVASRPLAVDMMPKWVPSPQPSDGHAIHAEKW